MIRTGELTAGARVFSMPAVSASIDAAVRAGPERAASLPPLLGSQLGKPVVELQGDAALGPIAPYTTDSRRTERREASRARYAERRAILKRKTG
jgi:hypothetical protein